MKNIENWKIEKRDTETAQTKKAQVLVGATIKSALIRGHDEECDGVNVLVLETDKGIFEIEGRYGGYTGNSCDEYYEWISVKKV